MDFVTSSEASWVLLIASLSSTFAMLTYVALKKPKQQCTIDMELLPYTPLLRRVHDTLFADDHVTFVLDKNHKKVVIKPSLTNNAAYYLEPTVLDVHVVEKTMMFDNVWANLMKCLFLSKQDDPDGMNIIDLKEVMQRECGINDLSRYLHIDCDSHNDIYVYLNNDSGNITFNKVTGDPWSKVVITPRNECFAYVLLSREIGFTSGLEEFMWFLNGKFD